jgi:hypothetical protein
MRQCLSTFLFTTQIYCYGQYYVHQTVRDTVVACLAKLHSLRDMSVTSFRRAVQVIY